MLFGEYHVRVSGDGAIALPRPWAGYPEGCALRARFSFERTAIECISAKDDALRTAQDVCAETMQVEGVVPFREADPIELPVENSSFVLPAEMAEELGIASKAALVGGGRGF